MSAVFTKTRTTDLTVFSIIYAAALAVWLIFGRDVGISSVIWPSTSIALATVVMTGSKHSIVKALAVAVIGTVVHLALGDSALYAISCAVSKALVFLTIIGGLNRWGICGDAVIDRRIIVVFSVLALLGTIPGAVLGTAASVFSNSGSLSQVFLGWWLPETASLIMFLPPFLFWHNKEAHHSRDVFAGTGSGWSKLLHDMEEPTAWLILAWVAASTAQEHQPAILTIATFVLIWFAFRRGLLRTAIAASLFSIMLIAGIVVCSWPAVDDAGRLALMNLQPLLVTMSLPALLIATVMINKHRTQATLAESERRLAYALAGTNDGLWDWDIQNNAVFASTRVREILGYDHLANAITIDTVQHLIIPEHRLPVTDAYRAHERGDVEFFRVEFQALTRSREALWVVARGKIVDRSVEGKALRMVGTLIDVSERRKLEDGLRHLATHDSLTGLANRAFFEEQLAKCLARQCDGGKSLAVLLVDLDHFKSVNDIHGHAAGDRLIAEIGHRVLNAIEGEGIAARIGGDEFAIIVEGKTDWQLELLASRLSKTVSQPIDIDSTVLRPSVSIGIGVADEANISEEQLMAEADEALYAAKHAGRGTWRFKAMDEKATA